MQDNKRFIWGIITIALVFTSGCAYKTQTTRGDQHMVAGEVELAARAYEKSLYLKGNQPETRQKLTQALNQLETWRQTLINQAENAKTRGLNGLALLIYTKAHILRPDTRTRSQITLLKRHLSQTHGFKAGLVLKNQGDARQKDAMENAFKFLPDTLKNRAAKIQLTRKSRAGKTGDYLLVFETASWATQTRQEIRSGKYISGTMAVNNPEYERVLRVIDRKRHKLRQLKIDRHYAMNDIEHYEKLMRYENPTKKKETYAEKNLRTARERLTHIENLRENLYDDLVDRELSLGHIPQYVTKNIYSVKHYPVKIHTTKGRLPLSFIYGTRRFREKARVSFTDETHGALPCLGLGADPLDLPGGMKIKNSLMEKARERFETILADDLRIHRQKFLNRAHEKADPDRVADLLMIYCFLDPDHIPEQVSREIISLMRTKFGRTGSIAPEILKHQ